MKDVNEKKITPPLAIDSEFLHRAFANPCTSKASHTMGYCMRFCERNLLKISAPLPLNKFCRISPFLADPFRWAVPKQWPYIRHIYAYFRHSRLFSCHHIYFYSAYSHDKLNEFTMSETQIQLFFQIAGKFYIFLLMYIIQHCFICRPSDSIVSEDAGIEPKTRFRLDLMYGTL
jgi:hypothetical protein